METSFQDVDYSASFSKPNFSKNSFKINMRQFTGQKGAGDETEDEKEGIWIR